MRRSGAQTIRAVETHPPASRTSSRGEPDGVAWITAHPRTPPFAQWAVGSRHAAPYLGCINVVERVAWHSGPRITSPGVCLDLPGRKALTQMPEPLALSLNAGQYLVDAALDVLTSKPRLTGIEFASRSWVD